MTQRAFVDSNMLQTLEKARNDFIDLGFAVYGRYFGGLMTLDAKARWVHDNLIAGLAMIRSTHGIAPSKYL